MTTQTAPVDVILADHGLTASLDDVAGYITRQRWSGAQGMRIERTTVDDAAVLLHDDAVSLLFSVVHVMFEGGRERRYALPLGLRAAGDPLAERAPAFIIGPQPDGRLLYDALGDPAYVHLLWQAIRQHRTIPTAQGLLRCEPYDSAALEDTDTPWMRVLTVEQSNTSMELGDRTFVKHLRRIEAGPSHELEMASTLSRAGFSHVPPVYAAILYDAGPVTDAPVVIVQPFLRNTSDGWVLALTSLRDLYADAEEALANGAHDVERVVAEQGGAFTGEASRLGRVIAEMHATLAAAHAPGIRAEPVTRTHLERWAGSMSADLDRLLAAHSSQLDELRRHEGHIRSQFAALRALRPSGLCTRIHGDLHLGQTLRIDTGWVILDFEGEPDRGAEERRELSSPLRDVAGMLRSFDYAAAVALTERLMPESADWEGMMAFGDEWARQNRAAFWTAYVQAVAGTSLLPDGDDAVLMRRAFELQKAVYEVGYEMGHRPTWAGIPLRFLLRGDDAARN